jgi:hypothetical protein
MNLAGVEKAPLTHANTLRKSTEEPLQGGSKDKAKEKSSDNGIEKSHSVGTESRERDVIQEEMKDTFGVGSVIQNIGKTLMTD